MMAYNRVLPRHIFMQQTYTNERVSIDERGLLSVITD
jgi:hypothetical protein